METFSSSVIKVLIWLVATTTKICTEECFIQAYGYIATQTSHPPTRWCINLQQRSGIGVPLQRHPFSGLVHSAGELLHTPERISTSMTIVLLSEWTNTFYGIWWASTLTPYQDVRFSPHRQFCLPKTAHLKFSLIQVLQLRKHLILPIQSLRMGRGNISPMPLIIRFIR